MAITNIIKTGGTSMNPILSANIDNIDFTNIPAGKIGTKESTFWNVSTNTDVWKDGGDGTQWKPSVNVVDIDWNGAQVAEKTLNTTGEVLSVLQTTYNYATTYTGKTTLTSSTKLGTINGKSLTYGGSIDIEVGSDVTETTVSDWGFTKNAGTVKSVNNSTPDQNGNVSINVGTNVTESTVSGWGFTKNAGTVTGIKMNGGSKGTSGVVDLGTVLVNISENYQTDTNNNTALSTSGALTLYTDLSETIDNLQTTINNLLSDLEGLTNRVAALENHHTTVPVSSIRLNNTSLTLTGKDATASLSAIVEPTNATNKTIKWTSSNEDVVTVSSTGKVTAKGISVSSIPAIITAYATDGSNISDRCSVTVNDGTVTLNGITPQNPTIEEGQTQEFRLSYINTSFDDVNFTWTVKQGDVEYNNLISSISSSSNIVLFTAPTFGSTSAELYTYTLTVREAVSASGANTSTTITVTKKEEPVETKYYWYVGKTKPTTSTNPESEIATADTAMGWHLIGTSFNADDYNSGNMLHKGGAGTINIDPDYNDVEYYIALPVGIGIYNGFGNDITANYTLVSSSITIAGAQYNVYSDVNSEFGFHIY